MAKRKMVQNNLIKNSIAAYFAAIEIHNKPNISYRYETVTLLILNAWELALKAYVRKYIKHRNIYEKEEHTISLDKALGYVTEDINSKNVNSFEAVRRNIEEIEIYRNGITHFYCDELEPYIFMLVARAALNFVEFMKEYFSKDIMADDGLFIMPLGFKLPFRPEDFLSNNVAKYVGSPESIEFIHSIVRTIEELDEAGIDDSIVLGFDMYLESVKKVKNSDLIAAISTIEEASVVFNKTTHIKITDDPGAAAFNMSDDEFRAVWKYTFQDIVDWCRANINGFKQASLFYAIKKKAEENTKYAYRRRLDNNNMKSPSKFFYTDSALEYIKAEYERQFEADQLKSKDKEKVYGE